MVFAKLGAEVVEEGARQRHRQAGGGITSRRRRKVEEACEYLCERGIVAYPYTTELPVAVLGAKYRWARGTGVL